MSNEKPRRIVRAKHSEENPYFLASRATAQDNRLSLEARGLLMYILSKPDHWQVRYQDLKKEGIGRDKADRILDELRKYGYMRSQQERGDKGRFAPNTWEVHETPFTENPYTVEPLTVNPQLDITESTESTDKNLSASKNAGRKPRKRNEMCDAVTEHLFETKLGTNPETEKIAAMTGVWLSGGKAPKNLNIAPLETPIAPADVISIARFFRQLHPDAKAMRSMTAAVRWTHDWIAAGKPVSNSNGNGHHNPFAHVDRATAEQDVNEAWLRQIGMRGVKP